MKNLKSNRSLTTILLSILLVMGIFIQCRGPENELGPVDGDGEGILAGKVVSESGNGIAGVMVSCNDKTAYTNAAGEFILENISVKDRNLVNFEKANYANNQRIVKLTDKKKTYVEAALFKIGKTTVINSNTSSSVSANGVKVEFQANSFVDMDGSPYSGDATVNLTYFNPANEFFFDAFPGEFMGQTLNGNDVPIESFGFIDVEIYNGSEKLQLAEGKPAFITMPVPPAYSSRAPEEIPLWFYNEEEGKWIEYGTAVKTGNEYIGEVSHFTKINCDMKYDERCGIKGRVVNQDGEPLSNAHIKLQGIDFSGGGRGYTDEDGTFEFINVKANDNIQIQAAYSGFFSASLEFASASNGQTKDVGDIEIYIDPDLTSGWSQLKNIPSAYYYDLFFIDENTGWIATSAGIYKTINGGSSWEESFVTEDSGSMVQAIFFTDNYIGWAAGSLLLHTTDGGQTWAEVAIENNKHWFSGIYFANSSLGFVLGYPSYRTTDAGASWETMENVIPDQTTKNMMSFTDDNNGWLAEWNYIKRTTDGGNSWQDKAVPDSGNVGGIFFVNSTTGWYCTYSYRDDSKIYNTTDAGETWVEQSHNAMSGLRSIFFINNTTGWIVGQSGAVVYTEDAGNNWTNQYTGLNSDFIKVMFINKDIGWIIGNEANKGVLMYTTTGGQAE